MSGKFVIGFFEWFDSDGNRHHEVVYHDPRIAEPIDRSSFERAVTVVEDGLAKSGHSVTPAERTRLVLEFYHLLTKEHASCRVA